MQPARLEILSRPTTRYGSIQQHEITLHGARKLVLVVDAERERERETGTPDEYSEWIERWKRLFLREREREREGERVPLLHEGVSGDGLLDGE